MINQRVKNIYFALMLPLSRLLKHLYRFDYALRRKHIRKLHIGCGKRHLPGFINIDGSITAKADYFLDVRAGLPFPDASIEVVYSCHMLEHLYVFEALSVLKEWYRILSPSGYARVVLPDFNYIYEILEGRATTDFPRKFKTRSGMAVNHLFCDGQHKFAYNVEILEELAMEAGFSKVVRVTNLLDLNISNFPLDEPGGSFVAQLLK